MFQFYRKYIADIRFNNPDLKLTREATPDGPLVARMILVSSTGKGSEEDLTIESNRVKSVDELRDKILHIHNELL
jgi:hypothetical protein